jgi:hypothetical protein
MNSGNDEFTIQNYVGWVEIFAFCVDDTQYLNELSQQVGNQFINEMHAKIKAFENKFGL